MTGDLFGAPKVKAPPRKPRVISDLVDTAKPAVSMGSDVVSGAKSPILSTSLVASFACYCSFRDEVKEPAPETIKCECGRDMHRWQPRVAPPLNSARRL